MIQLFLALKVVLVIGASIKSQYQQNKERRRIRKQENEEERQGS